MRSVRNWKVRRENLDSTRQYLSELNYFSSQVLVSLDRVECLL